jgi:hypothetical protein
MSTRPQIQITADPTADEVAAAIAAIVSLTDGGAGLQESPPEPAANWRGAAKLVAQGLVPSRTPTRSGWGRIERIRRAGKGGSGITGL